LCTKTPPFFVVAVSVVDLYIYPWLSTYFFTLWKESLNSDGHQFHQYQQNKESLNSDDHQFHQYQQNEQSPLTSNYYIGTYKKTTTCDIGNPGP
jgi:hypothetical protein